MKINGVNWLIENVQKYGDVTVISGIRDENAVFIRIKGCNTACRIYKSLIEAVAIYNKRGHQIKLYLDIPFTVREKLKRWIGRHNLSQSILFSNAFSYKEKEFSDTFSETITTSSVFEDCFIVPNQSRMIEGNITGILTYLEERFGE